MWRSFVKNYFEDDGDDIQLVTNRFDWNTYCTVSGGSFVYSFSFLRNWSIQSYSALMPVLHLLLTPKSSNLWQKMHKTLFCMGCWIYSFQTLNLFFSEYTFCLLQYSENMVTCLQLKHFLLGFNMHHHLHF